MNLDDFLQSPGLYDEMYERYSKDPKSVDPSWKKMFEGEPSLLLKEAPALTPPKDTDVNLTKNSEDGKRLKVESLANAYRKWGHQFAHFNPLQEAETDGILEYGLYGFTVADLNKDFPFKGKKMSLSAIIKLLKDTYRGKVGYEFEGFVKPEVAQFIIEAIEGKPISIDIETKQLIFEQLSKSELFESFMHTKFVGQKRFSLEGAETLIPMLKEVVVRGSEMGIEDFVIGMAHRGRLNVLSNILNKSYNDIFAEFDEAFVPDSFEGTGDVKYHKGFETETALNGKNIKITLTP
ncbi:MAG: 2-oxoglutarate dehydrogenase E1 subunit family protein, partial [Parachlamydiaceae bacterium]